MPKPNDLKKALPARASIHAKLKARGISQQVADAFVSAATRAEGVQTVIEHCRTFKKAK